MSTFSFAKHARKKLGSQLTLDTINGVTEVQPAVGECGQVIMGQLALGKGCRPDGSFTLGHLLATDGATKLPFVGSDLGRLREGALVRLRGRWSQNSEYGWQFQAESVESRLPTTPEGIRRYIEANIQRCGPTRADKLIGILGEETLTALFEAPSRAGSILGGKVGQQVAESFATWASSLRSDAEQSHFEARLYSAGMTRRMVNRVFRHFQTREETERVILTQPYRLIQVPGIGFKKADALALGMGVSVGDPSRVAAGVVYALEQAKGIGHSALPPSTLIRDARQALELTSDHPVEEALQRGLTEGTLVEEQGLLFLPKTRDTECHVVRVVRQLLQRPRPLSLSQRSRCDAIIADTELAPTQQRAVWMGLEHGCSILTGRPGAGKTTTTKVFVTCAQALDLKVLLAAPTGKAAARAAEVTGIPAQTIHMMIGGFPGSIRKEPLDADVVIVDESSMVDIELAAWLLRNINPRRTRVLFVGDRDQLPSVGHGAFLRDMLASGIVPSVELKEIFRQAGASDIVQNAHRLLDGEPLKTKCGPQSDFQFADVTLPPTLGPDGFPLEDDGGDLSRREQAFSITRLKRALQYLVQELEAKPVEDIQVLAPMLDGTLGVNALNTLLQGVLNAHGEEGPIIRGRTRVRVGDRVIQMRNNYTLKVFNGEQGVVQTVDRGKERILVSFPQRTVWLESSDLDDVSLAWAITVHRSQGSEFKYCLLFYHTAHWVMLSVPLLYTAITRARKLMIVIGNQRALRATMRNAQRDPGRHTGVTWRLQEGVLESVGPRVLVGGRVPSRPGLAEADRGMDEPLLV